MQPAAKNAVSSTSPKASILLIGAVEIRDIGAFGVLHRHGIRVSTEPLRLADDIRVRVVVDLLHQLEHIT